MFQGWMFHCGLPLPNFSPFHQPPLKIHNGRKRKAVVLFLFFFFLTFQRCQRTSKRYKFAAFRYWLTSMALQTVQMSFKPRLSTATHKAETALKDRSVLPKSHSLCAPRLRYHVLNNVVLFAGTSAKRYPLSELFSKQNCCI